MENSFQTQILQEVINRKEITKKSLCSHRTSENIDTVVPGEGLEPSRHCWHRILSPARLPIPPSRLKMR